MSPAGAGDFQLEIDRGLELKLFKPADAEMLFELTDRNRQYLREWLPWVDQTRSAAEPLRFITEVVQPQWRDGRGPQCGIWLEGALAGGVGCHPIDWQNRSCSVGYWVASCHQGRGIMTRCVSALLDYLFTELHLHRVVIQCGTGNRKSCAIPQRLGFRRDGVLREAEWVGFRWVDLMVWSMLDSEWRKPPVEPQSPGATRM
jgi:ribosomal-protein-serine acetyltransferase